MSKYEVRDSETGKTKYYVEKECEWNGYEEPPFFSWQNPFMLFLALIYGLCFIIAVVITIRNFVMSMKDTSGL